MMVPRLFALSLLSLAGGCGGGVGTWTLSTWGEDFIEVGISSDDFADGCSVVFDRFAVVLSDRALLDDGGEEVGTLDGAQVYDLVKAGPVEQGVLEVPAGTYRSLRVRLAPSADAEAATADESTVTEMEASGASMLVEGTLTCGTDAVHFVWPIASSATYVCDPTNLVVGGGSAGQSEFTVHGDHLFYDSLVDPEAQVVGRPLVDADANDDGELTVAELEAAPVAPTGFDVGARSEITNLWDYVQAGSQSVGHVDGEGHCTVTLD